MYDEEVTIILSKGKDCNLEDRINIGISPMWMSSFVETLKQRALRAETYDAQAYERRKADFFIRAYEAWKIARKERNEQTSGE